MVCRGALTGLYVNGRPWPITWAAGIVNQHRVSLKVLNLSLGKSHPILFQIPEGVKITVAENTKIAIEGIDNQLVGQCAANIRAFYPPEPYKGKGVRFAGEQLRRKEGKTVQ